MKTGSRRDESFAEINIIPLVDIMLVLLIIFMVAAPMLQDGIEIELPEVLASSVPTGDKDVSLTINKDGEIFLNGDDSSRYSLLSVEEKLMDIFRDRAAKIMYLRADQGVRYGYVVEVMAMSRRAGVEKIGMITEAPEKPIKLRR